MRVDTKRTDIGNPELRRVERLERLEGMTDKIFMGVVALVVVAAAIAMIAT